MSLPPVSCVMATKDRPAMVSRAVSMFALQDYEDKELVIADSSSGPEVEEQFGRGGTGLGIRICYFRMDQDATLGDSLNAGFESASGTLIHKWDDDDLYGAGFLSHALAALDASGAVLAAWSRFLVITRDGLTRISERGLIGGGSLFMRRDAWEQVRWRRLPRAVDAALWQDFCTEFGPQSCFRVEDAPELYTVVRHGRNLWDSVQVPLQGGLCSVPLDEVLKSLPAWNGGKS